MNLRTRTGMALLFLLAISSCAKSPVISVSPEKLEFGILSPGEIVEDTLWIKNLGTGVLETTIRSGCDCIEFESNPPDTILPGDSAALAIVYYAPDSAQEDRKSILISTNDKQNKILKVELTANIRKRRLARGDSTITAMPIYIQNEKLKTVAQKVIEDFFKRAPHELGLKTVSPIEVAKHIAADHQYRKRPIEDVIRKWALMDSIRWIIACQVSQKNDSSIRFSCVLVDGFWEFPIPIKFSASSDNASDKFISHLKDVFSNIDKYRRDAMMQGMQKKWAYQRSRIIGKALPKMQMVDVVKKDTLTEDSVAGKVLLMHFFSIDCEHCEEEIEWLTKLINSHPENLVVWGVSVDMGEMESVAEFAKRKNLPYPIVLPTEKSHRRFTRIYGGATPQTIIVAPDGKVVDFFVGFNKALISRLETILDKLTKNK
ncbi:hypothetical protein DRQ26_03860 [bacterium]|nr:MAG: hypothetical protein DRQ26_03860 [bacterium]